MNFAKPSKTFNLDFINGQQAKREADRAQANRDELAERISVAIRHDGAIEPLKGLHFNRFSVSAKPFYSVSIPAFCAIAQGSKEVLLGKDIYQYDPAHYLLATAELPVVSQILEASTAKPYLSLRLDLDPTLVGSVMVETGYSSAQSSASVKAIDVSSLDAELLDAVVRLVRLLDSPAEAHVLTPPTPERRAGRSAPAYCHSGWLHSPHCQSCRSTAEGL
jgi:AraC-type transcriptional regulator N-terminus